MSAHTHRPRPQPRRRPVLLTGLLPCLLRGLRSGAGPAAGERGSASLELTILAPAVLLIVSLLVLVGRVSHAQIAVDAAAWAAAREASIARTSVAARTGASSTASIYLTQQGITCTARAVSTDTSGFRVPAGQPAQVEVTVACTVPLGDLALPGTPGSITLTGEATSALDTYRERS